MGQIVQEDGTPLDGAKVILGSHTYTTRTDGVFFFSDIQTPQNACLIRIKKTGYFDAFRTVYVIPNQDNQVRIMAMAIPAAQTFSANTGGTISIPNGGSIDFEPKTIVDAVSNIPHTGSVEVYAKWIDPSSDNLPLLMPGSLRGINPEGAEQALASYGMQAVELRDGAGNELQLAQGSLATVHFPIPASLSGSAPLRIPLWSLDESNGMWVEEATAKKVGNEYVGAVSHFSYWNCDVPSNVVIFEATFVDQNNVPISGGTCVLKNSTQRTGFGRTNSSGMTAGPIPKNTNFDLAFYGPGCAITTTPLHTQRFSSGNTAVDLGTITVVISSPTTIKGRVVDCQNNPLPSAIVSIGMDNRYQQTLMTNSSGDFSTSLSCVSSNQNVSIEAYDPKNYVHGSSSHLVSPQLVNNIGNVMACGSPSGFINWSSTDGSSTTNSSAAQIGNSIALFYNSNITTIAYEALEGRAFIFVEFDGPQNSTGPHSLKSFFDHLDRSEQTSISGSPAVNITSYQAIGGWVEGNFTATLIGGYIPSRSVECSFRVKRKQ